jgi:hypothetical protein
MTPEEVAAVLAEHAGHDDWPGCVYLNGAGQPCLPFRLASKVSEQAAALAIATENVKRLRFQVEHLTEHEQDLTRQRAEQAAALARVEALAETWQSRGTSMTEFALTAPDDVQDELMETATDWRMRAWNVRTAVAGEQ